MTGKVKVTQSCLTLCDPMDCSVPGSSVRGILQAGGLAWVATAVSRGSSRPRDQTRVALQADSLPSALLTISYLLQKYQTLHPRSFRTVGWIPGYWVLTATLWEARSRSAPAPPRPVLPSWCSSWSWGPSPCARSWWPRRPGRASWWSTGSGSARPPGTPADDTRTAASGSGTRTPGHTGSRRPACSCSGESPTGPPPGSAPFLSLCWPGDKITSGREESEQDARDTQGRLAPPLPVGSPWERLFILVKISRVE